MFGSNSGTAFGSSASTGGIFGQANNAGGSAFGAANNASSGGMFGAKPPATGFGSNVGTSAFGAPAQNNNSGGMFGQAGTNTGTTNAFGAQNTNTGFGASNANTNTGAGLFDGSNTASSNTSGGIFGAKPATTTGFGVSSGSLFGGLNNASTQQSSGIFGAQNNNAPAASTGGLFGNANANKPAFGAPATGTASGIFGGAQNNAEPASTGGLFGAQNTAQQQPQSGGMFGANNNTASASTGLFGAKPAATTPTTGGLFGGASNTNSAPTGGIFGSNQPTAGGLFGNNAQATRTGQSSGLFGNNNASSTSGGGLFKNAMSNSTTGGSLFGGSQLMGQQQPQQQIQQQAQLPNITPLTTIGDLPDNFRQEIEQLDQFIQNQVLISEQLKSDTEEHREVIESIPRDVEYLQNKYSHINQALDNDFKLLQTIRASTDEALGDAENFFIILQRLLQAGNKTSSLEIDQYFNKQAEYYKNKLDKYTQALSEIDAAVEGIEKDSISDVGGMNLVVSTLHEEYRLFMEVADTVAEVHNKVLLLQEKAAR